MFDEQAAFERTQERNQFEDTTGGTSGVDIDNIAAHVAQKLSGLDAGPQEDDELQYREENFEEEDAIHYN